MARHRDSATCCRTANSGFDSRQGTIYVSAKKSRWSLAPTQPPIQWLPKVGVQQWRRESRSFISHGAPNLKFRNVAFHYITSWWNGT